jgi:hypothetical protein
MIRVGKEDKAIDQRLRRLSKPRVHRFTFQGEHSEDAPINTALGPERRPDVRNNQRVMLDDPLRAEDLWSRIRD